MLERIRNFLKFNTKKSSNEKIKDLFKELREDVVLIRLGEDLTDYAELFKTIIQNLRAEIKSECGFILPEVRLQEGAWLQENEYVVFIQGINVYNGYLIPNVEGINDEFYEKFKTVVYDKMDNIFTNELTEKYIDSAEIKNGRLMWNIAQILSVPEIKIILSDIISNGKSINNIGYVFEKIAEEILLNNSFSPFEKSKNLHEVAKKVAKVL